MNSIGKIRKHGQKPIISVVYETDDEQKAFHEEVRLIKKYGRRNNGTGILCNMTDGGEGATGHYGDLRMQWLIEQRKRNPEFKGEEEWKEIMDIIARGNFQEFIWDKQKEEIEQIDVREFEKFVLKHPELHNTYWGIL